MNARNGRNSAKPVSRFRCAIYTRKSTEDGLEQEFNSLDAQRESGEAYVRSQLSEGWECLADRYDDGGFTGGNMDRPALRRLLADIEAGRVDCVVVYKVDRLSRSLLDFARMMEVFEKHRVSFVSVTQQFNTATSMGRLVLNVLLSFAQFEREMISERTRDKIAATRRKGKWSGGMPVLGYNVVDTKLVIVPEEADRVRQIFRMYLEGEGLTTVARQIEQLGWRSKKWTTHKGTRRGGRVFDKTSLYKLLTNVTYIGQIRYKDEIHPGEHPAIVPDELWRLVQAKLEHHRRAGGPSTRNKYEAFLKGILHCVPCQCVMTPVHTTRGRTKRYRYYVCTAAQKRGWDTCPSKSIPAGEIEEFVVEQIRRIGRDPRLISETVRQAGRQTTECTEALVSERQRWQRDLANYHRELQQLAASQADERSVTLAAALLADLQERIVAAERRLSEIRDELERLQNGALSEEDVARSLSEFDPLWKTLGPREQARLLQLLIERIDYDGREETISITFHPSGIQSLGNHDLIGNHA